MSTQFLRRYTDLPALIYMLKEKTITLLDPTSWDDSNDSHFLLVYKRRKGFKTLLAICFTQVEETYHHWRVFAVGSSGVCIKFRRSQLIKAVEKCGGVNTGEVEYLKLKEIQRKKPAIDQLPFIKRHAFEDEREYRVIFESSESDLSQKDIPIPLSCIARITLSPWAQKSLTEHVAEVLRGIDGCKNIEIVTSTLICNNEWKRIGGFLRGNK
jgi:hypothetical protein